LTVAVVDDAGRLMDVCDLADDPAGYAQLGTLLAERSAGSTAAVAVAADSDEHQVTLLLAAAGRPLAIVEEESLDDCAERFGDEDSPDEMHAPVSERRAIGLARALQAGALAAATQSAPRELMALRPVLAAHAALAAGRQSAAGALREVLRELYPAALRAYPDPAEVIPLAILDALPEPGLLGATTSNRGRDAAVAADLAAKGLADHETISEAITALRVAIAETPRRTGIGKTLTTAVAETIQQAVAAVRACDSGIAALVGLLAEKSTPVAAPGRLRTGTPPLRAIREPAEAPPARIPVQRRAGARLQPAPVAVDPLRAPSVANPAVPLVPTPVPPAPAAPPSFVGTAADPYPSGQSYSYPTAYATGTQPIVTPSPEVGPPGTRADWPLNIGGTGAMPVVETAVTARSGGYQVTTPSPITSLPPTVLERRPVDPPAAPRQRDGRVTPPWQADDLPAEPPSLRLVEPGPLPDPALREDAPRLRANPDRDYLAGLNNSTDTGSHHSLNDLGLGSGNGRNGGGAGGGLAAAFPSRNPRDSVGEAPPRLVNTGEPLAKPSMSDEGDGDLLIFAQARSAWFTGHVDEEASSTEWENPADLGWRAAERAAEPVHGEDTSVGLPRRVPQANLVPGSALPVAEDRSLRIVRDPAAMAAHTTGYFRGSRRGEEVRGFAVGGRPGREAAGGWDFSRDGWDADRDERDYGYRSASQR
jgi:hypothetical protein